MIKPKVMPSPISDIQKTVDALLAAKKSATHPPAAVTTKASKIRKIHKSLNLPDLETYMRAFTDLPDALIDELLAIVEKSPSAMAVKTFARKWNLV